MSNDSSDPSGKSLERQLQKIAGDDVDPYPPRSVFSGPIDAMPAEFPILGTAVIVLKVLAVIYLVAATYGTYAAYAEAAKKVIDTSVALGIGVEPPSLAPFVFAFLKEAFAAFFIFVSGEVIKMLLEIHRAVASLKRL